MFVSFDYQHSFGSGSVDIALFIDDDKITREWCDKHGFSYFIKHGETWYVNLPAAFLRGKHVHWMITAHPGGRREWSGKGERALLKLPQMRHATLEYRPSAPAGDALALPRFELRFAAFRCSPALVRKWAAIQRRRRESAQSEYRALETLARQRFARPNVIL